MFLLIYKFAELNKNASDNRVLLWVFHVLRVLYVSSSLVLFSKLILVQFDYHLQVGLLDLGLVF